MLEKTKLENFAIFEKNSFEFSPQINIFIGKNSTGKSLLMKLLYSVITTLNKYGEEKSKETISYELSKKLKNVFLIDKVGKLTTRIKGSRKTNVEVDFDKSFINFSFSTRSDKTEIKDIQREKVKNAIYIPTKEIISMMDRGFIGLYEKYQFMEDVYYDLAKKLDKPIQKGSYDKKTQNLLKKLNLDELARIYRRENEFFTYIKGIGNLESKLVAEGYRKLMILIYLIKNGEFTDSKYLFWDEPEVNLNPALSKAIVELLTFLSKEFRTQIFIATHDYFIIKYFDLKHKEYSDKQKQKFDLKYFSLYLDKYNKLETETAKDLYELQHNSILDEFEEIYNYDVEILSKGI